MKEKRRKVKLKRWLNKNAMKIMCRYCAEYETCPNRPQKEQAEQDGTMTRCILTPNKKVKVASWEKVNSKGETINVNKNGIPVNKFFKEEYGTDTKDRKPYKPFNRRKNNESKSN